MLGSKDAMATIAVRDIQAAKKFYEGALGLKLADGGEPEALVYQSGSSRILVYQSRYAGTNKAKSLLRRRPGGLILVKQLFKRR